MFLYQEFNSLIRLDQIVFEALDINLRQSCIECLAHWKDQNQQESFLAILDQTDPKK